MLESGECYASETKLARKEAKERYEIAKNLYLLDNELDPHAELRILFGIEKVAIADLERGGYLGKDYPVGNLGPVETNNKAIKN